jgi:hypothetical protein
MDDKWRTTKCPNCSGCGLVDGFDAGPDECRDCGGSGRLWIRPSGHCFLYPGGPAAGMWSPEEYQNARPEPSFEEPAQLTGES